MARIVVAGYGNVLRGDDGAGWRVAEAIAERWGERVCVLLGQQPTPEWAPVLAAADVAFLVDATREAGAGLSVRRLEPVMDGQLVDGHTFGPGHLLGLAAALYGHVPESYLLLLPGRNFDFGEVLSPGTARAAQRALRFLDGQLRAWHARAGGGGA
ncbi:MAG TPA: hydrogenase maturation protease [Chloroflexota bacterium]|nr:hydrogenase maturation protease [Chloroflexota bacterium]